MYVVVVSVVKKLSSFEAVLNIKLRLFLSFSN